MNTDIFLALDLEFNQPSEKIIEIGICIGNIKTKEVLYNPSIIINPQEKLNPDIIKLTTITQEEVDAGHPLSDAIIMIKQWQELYKPFINPVTWGQGDIEHLNKEMGKHVDSQIAFQLEFGRRIIDVKTLFIGYCLANELKTQSGLAKSMTRLGLNFQGKKHRAVDDAKNTFLMFCKILEIFKNDTKRT